MPTEIGKGVTLIESAKDWDVYTAQIAEDTEGNKGEERPGEYPCLLVTDVQRDVRRILLTSVGGGMRTCELSELSEI